MSTDNLPNGKYTALTAKGKAVTVEVRHACPVHAKRRHACAVLGGVFCYPLSDFRDYREVKR